MRLQSVRRFTLPVALFAAVFPAIASAQLLPPPTPVFQSQVAQCQSNVAGNTSNSISDPHQVVYGPQAGWTILSYHVYDMGNYGTESENWSSGPAGSFVSSSAYSAAYNQAISAVLAASIPSVIKAQINAALTTSFNANTSYAINLNSSFGYIQMNTNATGQNHGWTHWTGGSSATLDLDVWLLQIEPYMLGADQFKSYLMNWTNTAIAKARGKITHPDWEQYLASSYARVAFHLANIAVHSPGRVDPNLQALIKHTAETMGWPAIDIATEAKKLPTLNLSGAVFGHKTIKSFPLLNLTFEQFQAQLKNGSVG